MVGSKAQYKYRNDGNCHVSHFSFLVRIEAAAGLNTLKNSVVCEEKDPQRNEKSQEEPADIVKGQIVIERSFKASFCGFFLDNSVEKHRAIDCSNRDKEGDRDYSGSPLGPEAFPSAFQCAYHSLVVIDRNAAQEKNADVDVAEKDIPSHQAGLCPHSPTMAIFHIDDPEGKGAQVHNVAQGQAKQVDGCDIFFANLYECHKSSQAVSW